MNFTIPTEIQMLLRTVREFVDEEIVPFERHFLLHDFDTLMPQLDALRHKAKNLGLWLPQIPSDYGGMGLSLLEHGLVSEVLGRSPLGHYVFNCQAPDAGNMEILIEHGTEAQKEQFLYPLLEGKLWHVKHFQNHHLLQHIQCRSYHRLQYQNE